MNHALRVLLPMFISVFFISMCEYGGSNIEVLVLEGEGMLGYVAQSLFWVGFTFGVLATPLISIMIKSATAFRICCLFYMLYTAVLIYPIGPLVYTTDFFTGFAVAVAQIITGSRVQSLSSHEEAGFNIGLYYACQMTAISASNAVLFLVLRGQTFISTQDRYDIMITLTAMGLVGVIVSLFIPRQFNDESLSESFEESSLADTQLEILREMGRTFVQPGNLLLFMTGAYLGLEAGFWMGVFGTSIGNSLELPNHEQLMGLSGIFVGLGNVSGAVFGTILSKYIRWKQTWVYAGLQLLASLVAYTGIYLLIPPDANIGPTHSAPLYTTPHADLYLSIIGFLLGVNDNMGFACMTVVFERAFSHHESYVIPFTLQFLLIGLSGSALFISSGYLPLKVQLYTLVGLSLYTALVLLVSDWLSLRRMRRRGTLATFRGTISIRGTFVDG